ncbi:MAG: hypothetical protein AAF547_22820 [Actinomycetota bacterium]
MSDRLLLLSHAGVTLVMVGIMWSVQLTIYPQFRNVPVDDFVPYVTAHATRIVVLLAPFAPLEILLALLVWIRRPEDVSGRLAFIAGLLLAIGWLSTALWYAPLHGELQSGHDAVLIDRLIWTNWFRTALWSIRGVFALSML